MRSFVLAAVAVIALVATGCGAGGSSGGRSAGADATPAGRALKPPIEGLLDRGPNLASGFEAPEPGIDGIVVNAHWADLQPEPNGPIARDNQIDRAVATARRWNQAHPHDPPVAVKVRVFAGVYAPQWAKRLGGAPIRYASPNHPRRAGTFGRFWTGGFGAAWQRLQRELAAIYDNPRAYPEIRDVTVSRCTVASAETMVRGPAVLRALVAHGYTAADDEGHDGRGGCIRDEIDEASVWRDTHLSVAFNEFHRPAGTLPSGRPRIQRDPAFTEAMMRYCVDRLGARCVLENNAIRATYAEKRLDLHPGPAGGKNPGAVYRQLAAVKARTGQTLTFQTAVDQLVGDLPATLRWAIQMGANSVELPLGWHDMITPAQLAPLRAALKRQAAR